MHFYLSDWLKNSDYEPIVGVLRHMENSSPSLKIFRTKFSTSALYNGRPWQVSEATKIQAMLHNAVPEKTKKATKFGMNIFNGTYLWILLENKQQLLRSLSMFW